MSTHNICFHEEIRKKYACLLDEKNALSDAMIQYLKKKYPKDFDEEILQCLQFPS